MFPSSFNRECLAQSGPVPLDPVACLLSDRSANDAIDYNQRYERYNTPATRRRDAVFAVEVVKGSTTELTSS